MDCNSTYLPATTTINNPSLLGGCAPSSQSQYMYFVDSSRNSNDNTTVQVTRNSHDSSNAGTSRFVVYQITIAHQIGSASAAPIDNKLSITLVSDNNVDNGRWCISSLSNQQQ